ncbi:hypothetical protein O181_010587 [Austropuccinia psidii MF-1]|uniref:Integrase catalytic domain-containing protein n=1 Tax=Austropuccinia psidii MF-1 TaxID=1389203 RepID=A0A9Q3BSX9_9BASI|nr:hypothetical protein [Austropuccinia psidii MF-1]
MVKTCQPCQKRSHDHQRKEGRISFTSKLFEIVSIDKVHVKAGRWKYLVVARNDFSGWPEKVGLVWTPEEVKVDESPEAGKELKYEVKEAVSRIRVTASYNSESQGMIERGHKKLKDEFVKMCGENGSKWKEYLPLATLADRIETKRQTVYSPFELQFGKKAILPIDFESKKYLAIEWNKVQSTEDLLEERAEQLSGEEEMRPRAKEKVKKAREDSVKYGGRKLAHKIRRTLHPGEIFLVNNKALESKLGLLFNNVWDKTYRVLRERNNVPYKLE